MTTNGWKNKAVVAWCAVAILVVVAIVTSLSLSSASTKKTADDTGNGVDHAAVVKLLTVTSVTEQCATRTNQHLVKYDVGALKGTPPRKWVDAVSTPLGNQGLAGVNKAVCTDPLYGVTVANMLSNLRVDGVTVASLNPWIRPFTDVSQVNDRAHGFIPLLDVRHPTNAQVQKAMQRNHDYQQLANRVNTLLSRFQVTGTDSLRSVKNWHLTGAGLKVGGLPEVGLDSRPDVKPALVLQATVKNACAPVARVGFNLGDKRPEVFPTPSCKQPTHPSTPSHSTPGCTSNCTPHPGCTSNCGPTPNCHTTGTCPTPNCHTTGTCPTPNCHTTGTCPTHHPCPCVSPTQATQPVPSPAPGDPGAPTHAPSAQPTVPANPSHPADPTPGGYNGGSTTQPGQSGSPTPVVPSSDPTNTGDPGGF